MIFHCGYTFRSNLPVDQDIVTKQISSTESRLQIATVDQLPHKLIPASQPVTTARAIIEAT